MTYITSDEASAALSAIQGGHPGALEAFHARYAPILQRLAANLRVRDRDEAMSVVSLAFMESVHHVSPYGARVDAVLYTDIRNTAQAEVSRQSSVEVPIGTVRRYWTIRNKYDPETGTPEDGREHKTHEECLRDAYEACKRREERMAPDVFLAVHRALYSHEDRVSLGTVDGDGAHDEYSSTPNIVDVGSTDNIDAIDTYDLVHNHLLPLLDDERSEGTVVRLGYGFTQLPPAVVDKLEAAGYQPGTVLSDGEIAEVLKLPGLGYHTVRNRRRGALATMRAYLEKDAAMEAAS